MVWKREDARASVRSQWADDDTPGFASDADINELINEAQTYMAKRGNIDQLSQLLGYQNKTTNSSGRVTLPSVLVRIVGATWAGIAAKKIPPTFGEIRGNYNIVANTQITAHAHPVWFYVDDTGSAEIQFFPAVESIVVKIQKLSRPTNFIADGIDSDLGDQWLVPVVGYCLWRLRMRESNTEVAALAKQHLDELLQSLIEEVKPE